MGQLVGTFTGMTPEENTNFFQTAKKRWFRNGTTSVCVGFGLQEKTGIALLNNCMMLDITKRLLMTICSSFLKRFKSYA